MAHRRREVSRIEGFSDAVFALALTLLVVSLEPPRTFHDLMQLIRGLPVFAVCFAMLFQVWWRQYRFFRSYDLEDSYVVAMTGVLLFLVVFFVYPLKFLWSLAFNRFEGRAITDEIITGAQVPVVFVMYGAAVLAVFTILGLLYWHAYRLRTQLALTPAEVFVTRVQIYRNFSLAGFGLLSALIAGIAAVVAPPYVGWAGFVYFGIGISETGLGVYEGRTLKKLKSGRWVVS